MERQWISLNEDCLYKDSDTGEEFISSPAESNLDWYLLGGIGLTAPGWIGLFIHMVVL